MVETGILTANWATWGWRSHGPARSPSGEPKRTLRSGGLRDPRGQRAQQGRAHGARPQLRVRTARAGMGPPALQSCCLNVVDAAFDQSGFMRRPSTPTPWLVAQRVP